MPTVYCAHNDSITLWGRKYFFCESWADCESPSENIIAGPTASRISVTFREHMIVFNLFYETRKMHSSMLAILPFGEIHKFWQPKINNVLSDKQLTPAFVWLITNSLFKCRCRIQVGKKEPHQGDTATQLVCKLPRWRVGRKSWQRANVWSAESGSHVDRLWWWRCVFWIISQRNMK